MKSHTDSEESWKDFIVTYPATWPPTYQALQSSSKVMPSSASQYSVDICETTKSWSPLQKYRKI